VETDDYLTADQAAEALGIARRSVYYYETYVEGFPQATRIGRTPMWNRKDIEAWREAHPSRKRAEVPEPTKRKPKKAAVKKPTDPA
jgi:predicted DNA-binding transcriptional regulator AlpA